MTIMRRNFLKSAVIGSAIATVGLAAVATAESKTTLLNGVTKGTSKKREITYKKTQAWEDYYKSAL